MEGGKPCWEIDFCKELQNNPNKLSLTVRKKILEEILGQVIK